ncbi:MAG: YicC family protein [Nitrospirae bacterium]|nr:YicC family protein [Nitrospirota bacterium]
MLKSMTGFGKREASHGGLTLSVEMRSVNHRHREVALRLPKGFWEIEDKLKALIYRQCARGRVDVTASLGGGKESSKTLSWDRGLAKQYSQALREMQRELKVKGEVDITLLAGYRDIFSFGEKAAIDEKVQKMLTRLVTQALGDLDGMRRREGKMLQTDLTKRVHGIEKVIRTIERRTPMVVREYAERMKKRVGQLLDGEPVDQGRVAQELAVYAERCDVTEELIRLDSHVAQFHLLLKESEPVGRKLDFLLQEMGREVNTIGSKANNADISGLVVELKSELEKIREQVQNIE